MCWLQGLASSPVTFQRDLGCKKNNQEAAKVSLRNQAETRQAYVPEMIQSWKTIVSLLPYVGLCFLSGCLLLLCLEVAQMPRTGILIPFQKETQHHHTWQGTKSEVYWCFSNQLKQPAAFSSKDFLLSHLCDQPVERAEVAVQTLERSDGLGQGRFNNGPAEYASSPLSYWWCAVTTGVRVLGLFSKERNPWCWRSSRGWGGNCRRSVSS